MGRVAYASGRGCRPTGYRSPAAGELRFARSREVSAADSGAVVLRRAEFLKEALSGGFGNRDDEVSVMEQFFCVDNGADLSGVSAAMRPEGLSGDGFHRPVAAIGVFMTDKF